MGKASFFKIHLDLYLSENGLPKAQAIRDGTGLNKDRTGRNKKRLEIPLCSKFRMSIFFGGLEKYEYFCV